MNGIILYGWTLCSSQQQPYILGPIGQRLRSAQGVPAGLGLCIHVSSLRGILPSFYPISVPRNLGWKFFWYKKFNSCHYSIDAEKIHPTQHKGLQRSFLDNQISIPDFWLIRSLHHTSNLFNKHFSSHGFGTVSRTCHLDRLRIF